MTDSQPQNLPDEGLMLPETLRIIASYGPDGMPTLDVADASQLGLVELVQDLRERPMFRTVLTEKGKALLEGAQRP